jgi:protein-tyrosine phosphatase
MTAANRRPGQSLGIATVPNLRDLGGWPTPAGPVRTGLLYRSAEFDQLQGDDLAAFTSLGVKSVYDLRTEAERAAQPNRVPPGIDHIVLDVLQGSSGAAPAMLAKVLSDPKAAQELLGGGKAQELFEHGYREIVSLPSALAGYKHFFGDLAQDAHRPALFHCTTGKDRTGWAAASMLMLLGASDEDVLADYLLTNDQLLPALQPLIDKFASIGGDPALLGPVLGVRKEYLHAALDEMQQRFTGIEGYFSTGLGLDTATIDTLRATFTQPGRLEHAP